MIANSARSSRTFTCCSPHSDVPSVLVCEQAAQRPGQMCVDCSRRYTLIEVSHGAGLLSWRCCVQILPSGLEGFRVKIRQNPFFSCTPSSFSLFEVLLTRPTASFLECARGNVGFKTIPIDWGVAMQRKRCVGSGNNHSFDG